MCQESFNGVLKVFQGSFRDISRKFQECFNLRKILGYFKKVSRFFQERSKVSQGSFQWVSRVLERSSEQISGKFQICFRGFSRKFYGCSRKDFSVLQRSFKKVSSVLQENFNEKFLGVSRMF